MSKVLNNLIADKNLSGIHSKEDIKYIINSYLNNSISDDLMEQWLLAVCNKGMNFEETSLYTNEIINSNKKIIFDNKKGYFIDKHSTGGVGDKVSLILGPILAACGCYVPMIVGRALGHTGGTLDKLESIPGYNGLLSIDNFKNIVNEVGISIIGQTNEICPADRKIYNLRSKTNTVKSYPLICGSIMGKKIAEGTQGLVLDIKTGNGAFMNSIEEGKELGELLKKVGKKNNVDVEYAFTDMNQPLGYYSGLFCEVFESIEFLKGNCGSSDLVDLIYDLGENCLTLAEIDKPKDKIKNVIFNGSAYEIFCKMVYSHGARLNKIKFNPKEMYDIKSNKSGRLSHIDTKQLGISINSICYFSNGGTDAQAGMKIKKKLNDDVSKNDVLATVFSSNKNKIEYELEKITNSFTISPEPWIF